MLVLILVLPWLNLLYCSRATVGGWQGLLPYHYGDRPDTRPLLQPVHGLQKSSAGGVDDPCQEYHTDEGWAPGALQASTLPRSAYRAASIFACTDPLAVIITQDNGPDDKVWRNELELTGLMK